MTTAPLQNRFSSPVKRVLLPTLRLLDRIAQRLVPVKANRVFYASMPDYADSAHAVYRHLLETRRDLEHVWLVRDRGLTERIRAEFAGHDAEGHRVVVKAWSPRSYLSFLPRPMDLPHPWRLRLLGAVPGRTAVCLWHGMPVKAIRRLHDGDFEMFPVFGTVHVATSSFFRYIIAGVFGVHPSSVLVSGLPRVDVLKGHAPPRHDRAAIARHLGLDPGGPGSCGCRRIARSRTRAAPTPAAASSRRWSPACSRRWTRQPPRPGHRSW